MAERLFPQNSCLETVLMIEGADLRDLLIIIEQFEQDNRLYSIDEAATIIHFISKQRQIVESNLNIDRIKKRMKL